MPLDFRLTKYKQPLSITDGTGVTYEIKEYIGGVSPILVRKPTGIVVLTQSGSATAWHARFAPPAPLFPNALLERPQISYERDGAVRWVTTWTYQMAVDNVASIDVAAAAAWPTAPQFLPITPNEGGGGA